MNHFTAPVITVTPDDDLPHYPDPGEDALSSPQSRRYFRACADGHQPYSRDTQNTRLPVSIHG